MGGLRTCSCCGIAKDITCFHKNGKKQGRLHKCIECRWEQRNKKERDYYYLHPNKMKEKRDKWYQENKKYSYLMSRKWRKVHPERIKELQKKYNDKKSSTIKGRLSASMSGGIYKSLKRKKNNYHWETLVNFTTEQLKNHIENQFVDGMSWENYGEWHIDHIIPVTFFQYNSFNDVEFKMCWRLENLQPLWATDNIRKGNKVRRVA